MLMVEFISTAYYMFWLLFWQLAFRFLDHCRESQAYPYLDLVGINDPERMILRVDLNLPDLCCWHGSVHKPVTHV